MSVKVLENLSFMYNGTEVRVEKLDDSNKEYYEVVYDDGNSMFRFRADVNGFHSPDLIDYINPEGLGDEQTFMKTFWDIVTEASNIV